MKIIEIWVCKLSSNMHKKFSSKFYVKFCFKELVYLKWFSTYTVVRADTDCYLQFCT